ncbi:hypothetical protein MTR67_008731 [Solanum verrucosum]|nr:hypothetical protein MTR67_008731 [Solanum verrucosum]
MAKLRKILFQGKLLNGILYSNDVLEREALTNLP